MKRCPTCSRVYDDLSLQFCLDDGTQLVNKVPETAPPTAVLPGANLSPTIGAGLPKVAAVHSPLSPTVVAPPPAKRRALPWLLVALLLLLGGIGIITAILLLTPKQRLTWHLVLQVEPTATDRNSTIGRTVSVIESRLNAARVPRFEVRPDGDSSSGRILVNLPNLPEPERVKNLISAQGKLEIVHVLGPANPAPAQTYSTRQEAVASLNSGGAIPANRRVLRYSERDEIPPGVVDVPTLNKWVVVESPSIIDGNDLRDASAIKSNGPDYFIAFSLKKDGAEKFGAWTGVNINEYIGVVLNDEVKSIAFIRSQIVDRGEINGRFTKESAEDLALVLRSGALPAPVKFVAENIDR